MKFTSLFLLLASSASAAAAVTDKTVEPPRISFKSLSSSSSENESSSASSFLEALTSVGIVSITDIPFKNNAKYSMLSHLYDCADTSTLTQEETFPDGTRRRTLATHTVPGGVQKLQHNSNAKCSEFSKASDDFRQTVATVTNLFAQKLESVLALDDDASKPLLSTANGEYSFSDLTDVVTNGEHLEHFHSYQKESSSTTTTNDDQTIDIHTDQGLFIAFTPGLLMDTTTTTSASPKVANGFFLQLQDGTVAQVNFNDQDDLVFMLGDGVNQVINNNKSQQKPLRAAPHALTMPTGGAHRVWYGRMVLPPMDAMHPLHQGQTTFGEIRQALIDGEHSAASLACSGATSSVRNLQDTSCDADSEVFCWHRCMSGPEFGVTEALCMDQGLDFRCINPRRQLYVKGHGDYYPACIDASQAENATAYPALRENEPWDAETCTTDMLTSFKSSVSAYENELNLGNATLLYTVTDDGMLDGKFVFNGLFGWLAFGFAKEDGSKNGMGGATVIMALPGGNYSAQYGLDLDMDPTVEEYVIDPTKSAFRHWMTPVSSTTRASTGSSSYTVEATDCFTAISFKTDHIFEQQFNLDGTDDLIWGANAEDYFVGYHGRQNRARFQLDWTTGQASVDGIPINQVKEEETGPDSGGATAAASTVVVVATLAVMTTALFM